MFATEPGGVPARPLALTATRIIRQIALTGCRRGEIIGLKWAEADTEGSAFRFTDTKTGESIRPIGLPVVDFLEALRPDGIHPVKAAL